MMTFKKDNKYLYAFNEKDEYIERFPIKDTNGAIGWMEVYQYDLNGKLIQIYPTLRIASYFIKVAPNKISTVAHTSKTAHGYHFKTYYRENFNDYPEIAIGD